MFNNYFVYWKEILQCSTLLKKGSSKICPNLCIQLVVRSDIPVFVWSLNEESPRRSVWLIPQFSSCKSILLSTWTLQEVTRARFSFLTSTFAKSVQERLLTMFKFMFTKVTQPLSQLLNTLIPWGSWPLKTRSGKDLTNFARFFLKIEILSEFWISKSSLFHSVFFNEKNHVLKRKIFVEYLQTAASENFWNFLLMKQTFDETDVRLGQNIVLQLSHLNLVLKTLKNFLNLKIQLLIVFINYMSNVSIPWYLVLLAPSPISVSKLSNHV